MAKNNQELETQTLEPKTLTEEKKVNGNNGNDSKKKNGQSTEVVAKTDATVALTVDNKSNSDNKSDAIELKKDQEVEVQTEPQKGKKEKELTPEQIAKKLEDEKLERKRLYKEQKNKFAIENDLELRKKQIIENRRLRKSLINNGTIFLLGTGTAVGLMLMISPFLAAIALPIWGLTIFNTVKTVKTFPKLKSAYELKIMLIIEQARKTHEERNKQIIEAYKAEKQRIKSLKRLPYKILNYISFFTSMFIIIFFFFILNIGIAATALVLFAAFTVTYFLIGVLMIGVAYMVSENKQREAMLKLEEEKNRLLIEEKIRSEEAVRIKLERERRKYEEEERLRLEEQIRRQKEEEERLRAEEELRLLKEEEERLRVEEEERIRKEEEEKELKKQNMIKESKFIRMDYLPPPPTKAEIAKDVEVIRNEFDRKMLDELSTKFDELDMSGIEEFGDKERIKTEYASGITFPDVDLSDEGVEKEIDNTLLQTVKKEEDTNFLTNFNTTDIEEAKTLIFKNARIEKDKQQKTTAKSNDDDEITTQDLLKEVSKKVVNKGVTTVEETETTGKTANVSGKSFLAIKQMLKDG
jgi:hypothetical protein